MQNVKEITFVLYFEATPTSGGLFSTHIAFDSFGPLIVVFVANIDKSLKRN